MTDMNNDMIVAEKMDGLYFLMTIDAEFWGLGFTTTSKKTRYNFLCQKKKMIQFMYLIKIHWYLKI